MRLIVENIGAVNRADVRIDGITVIAGKNGTGKSTISRSLYSIFNGLTKAGLQVGRELVRSIEVSLLHSLGYPRARCLPLLAATAEEIAFLKEGDSYCEDDIARLLHKLIAELREEEAAEPLHRRTFLDKGGVKLSPEDESALISHILDVLQSKEEDIIADLMSRRLASEFFGQINDVNSNQEGKISLGIKEGMSTVHVEHDRVSRVDCPVELEQSAVYLDDPNAIDDAVYLLDSPEGFRKGLPYSSRITSHREDVSRLLVKSKDESGVIDERLAMRKLSLIEEKIDAACGAGSLGVEPRRLSVTYRQEGSAKPLNPRNLSLGLKSFVILKSLLRNGALEENGTVILDEPEVHLHPEWQVVFAECIVLLHKHFGMHVLLTTHSPYFLNAIEVKAQIHGVDGKCRYYIAENDSRRRAVVREVTSNTDEIYAQLARPLQELVQEEYANE